MLLYEEIPFPFGGIDEGTAFSNQRALTCRDALNCRGYDAATDRNRGASRAGWSKYAAGQVSGGSHGVQELIHVTTPTAAITYANANPPTLVWDAASGLQTAYAMARDSYGDIYLLGRGQIVKMNQSGGVVWQRAIEVPPLDPTQPPESNVLIPRSLSIGSDDLTIYAAFASDSRSVRNGGLFKYEVKDGLLKTAWSVVNSGEWFTDVEYRDGMVYATYVKRAGGTGIRKYRDDGGTPVWDTELPGTAEGVAVRADGSCYVAINDPSGGVKKVSGEGQIVWSYPSNPGGHATQYLSVAVAPNNRVWAVGASFSSGGALRASYIPDEGNTFGSATVYTNASSPVRYPSPFGCCSVDEDGVLYTAGNDTGDDHWVMRVSVAGGLVWSYETGLKFVWDVLADNKAPSEAAPAIQHIYAAGEAVTFGNDDSLKLTQLTRTLSDTSTRTTKLVGLANGLLRYLSGGTWTNPSNGATSLETTVKYAHATVLNQKVYLVTGRNDIVFDPADNTWDEWTATTGGILPQNCRLLEGWRDRAVMSGNPDDPHNWYMSAAGDPHDHDYFPVVILATQAMAGNFSDAGRCPDIINAIIPVRDDLLIFGCDHTLYRLTGDPLEGGRFDLISDVTGVAFGRAWCKDAEGVVYFYGSRGGVYRMVEGTIPERISNARIEKRLQDINLLNNKVRLVWNEAEQALYVFVTPFSVGATTHYVWEKRNNAWWFDQLASTSFDPFAVHVMDGDAPGDRQLLIGGRDGYVRKWDRTEDQDDATSFQSYAVIGPIAPAGQSGDARLCEMAAVFGPGTGTVTYEVYATNDPATLGSAEFNSTTAGTLTAGRNHSIRQRARAEALFMKLGNGVVGSPGNQAWAFEQMTWGFQPAGRIRKRA